MLSPIMILGWIVSAYLCGAKGPYVRQIVSMGLHMAYGTKTPQVGRMTLILDKGLLCETEGSYVGHVLVGYRVAVWRNYLFIHFRIGS